MTVSGRAGAVRVLRLSWCEIAEAELHGKRLDASSKRRAIYPERPTITTTGLDLKELYLAHVSDAFVPESGKKVLHVLCQFPTELVDAEDAQMMLLEARAFAEKVFGRDAIFADRIDRDERSQHVVDLFMAPKYLKQTKHQSRIAVSTTKHLSDLAIAQGHWQSGSKFKAPMWAQGQALQTAWYMHLKDEMGLDVRRGEPKKSLGADWRSPEMLAREEARLGVKLAMDIYLEAGFEFDVRGQVTAVKPAFENRVTALPLERNLVFDLVSNVDRARRGLTEDARRERDEAVRLNRAAERKSAELGQRDKTLAQSESRVRSRERDLDDRESHFEALKAEIECALAAAMKKEKSAEESNRIAAEAKENARKDEAAARSIFAQELEKSEAEASLVKKRAKKEAEINLAAAATIREKAENYHRSVLKELDDLKANISHEANVMRLQQKDYTKKDDELIKRAQILEEREKSADAISKKLAADQANLDRELTILRAQKVGIDAINRGFLYVNSNRKLMIRNDLKPDIRADIQAVISPVLEQVSEPIIAYYNSLCNEAKSLIRPLAETFASLNDAFKAEVTSRDATLANVLNEPDDFEVSAALYNRMKGHGR
jgi:hypothetical protein